MGRKVDGVEDVGGGGGIVISRIVYRALRGLAGHIRVRVSGIRDGQWWRGLKGLLGGRRKLGRCIGHKRGAVLRVSLRGMCWRPSKGMYSQGLCTILVAWLAFTMGGTEFGHALGRVV